MMHFAVLLSCTRHFRFHRPSKPGLLYCWMLALCLHTRGAPVALSCTQPSLCPYSHSFPSIFLSHFAFPHSPINQADICQLGMDQRKVNMLAREYCDDIKRKMKPIILSHRMMPGLLEVRLVLCLEKGGTVALWANYSVTGPIASPAARLNCALAL